MAVSSYLNPDLSFNRAVIMQRAWHAAHYNLALDAKLGYASTLRACFAAALRREWDLARGHKACELHRIERDALFASLQGRDLRIAELQEARVCAVHIDNTREMVASLAVIDREFAALGVGAAA